MFRRHWGLFAWTLILLLAVAELPGWMMWSPLAALAALLQLAAARMKPLVAPALCAAALAAALLGHVPPDALSFGVALAVGSILLGAGVRAGMRPVTSVLLSSVPLAVWVVCFFASASHAGVEAAYRQALTTEVAQRIPFDGRLGLSPVQYAQLLKRAGDLTVLLLPTFSVVQAPLLMGWAYSLAAAWAERRPDALPALPRFSRMRLPDGAVWLLCLGLLLLVTRQSGVLRAGANLSAVMAVAYFVQGISVLTYMAMALRAAWMAGGAVVLILVMLLSPLFSVFTCILGLSDVWLDFRKLGAVAEIEAAAEEDPS